MSGPDSCSDSVGTRSVSTGIIAAVRIDPLAATDGFVLYDLDGTERSLGVARLAPKVLRESAELLARSMTYLFASFELEIGGASAGVNAKPDEREDAVAAFVG